MSIEQQTLDEIRKNARAVREGKPWVVTYEQVTGEDGRLKYIQPRKDETKHLIDKKWYDLMVIEFSKCKSEQEEHELHSFD